MATKSHKKMIPDTFYQFSGSVELECIIKDLLGVQREALAAGWTNLWLDVRDGGEVEVTGLRPETDGEYKDRVAATQKLLTKTTEKELKEFKRLQKIYGDKV